MNLSVLLKRLKDLDVNRSLININSPFCKKCARCCTGCLLLDYDKLTEEFKCLVYEEKYRKIISGTRYIRKCLMSRFKSYFIWINSLQENICSRYVCSILLNETSFLKRITDEYEIKYRISYIKKNKIELSKNPDVAKWLGLN